jgi:tripartite-type tricarboxylate transporter receptor subunit TctC
MVTRRQSILVLFLGATGSAPMVVLAQDTWPSRPITTVVPYAAGSTPDTLTRLSADILRDALGQPIVVDNRPGAGGLIGTTKVAHAAPDGYTIGLATVGIFAINEFLRSKLPFDPEKELQPVSLMYELPNVMVVPASNPARNVREFVEWAKRQPRPIAFGSPGVGNSAHLFGDLLKTKGGFEAIHVPYQTGANVIQAMLQGDIAFTIDVAPTYWPMVKEGKLRALAINGTARWAQVPDVPTFEESGFDGFDLGTWVAIAAPAGVPEDIIRKINLAWKRATEDAVVRQRFHDFGARIVYSTAGELRARIAREKPRWAALVKASGARID